MLLINAAIILGKVFPWFNSINQTVMYTNMGKTPTMRPPKSILLPPISQSNTDSQIQIITQNYDPKYMDPQFICIDRMIFSYSFSLPNDIFQTVNSNKIY